MARKSRKSEYSLQTKPANQSGKTFQAALYVRISVENEKKKESDTVGNQIQMLRDFVSQMPDIKVYSIYCDDDITGTTFVRPEFSRMMKDVREKKVNCIIVKDLSRLGRNYLESGEYLEKVFPFLGIRFIALNDRIDTLEHSVDISVQLKNMVNEIYAKDISKKICSSMKVLQEQGKFLGSQPPYGYRRNPKDKYALMIDSQTAPVVKRIFQKILDGYTIHAITLQLNEEKVPSPGRYKYEAGIVKHEKFKNSVWFFNTVRRLLSDPVYLGWIQCGKYESHFYEGGNKSVKVPREKWKILKGMHEPIISEEVFNQVQEILEQNAAAGRYESKHNKNNIFRGKLKCGECGKSMAMRERNSHGMKKFWYICPTHEHYNSNYCPKKGIKKEQLEYLVLQLLQKQMVQYVDAAALIRNLNRQSKSKNKYEIYQKQIKEVENQLERLRQSKAELYQDYAEHLITEEDYLLMGQNYSKKSDDLKIFLSELMQETKKYLPDYQGSRHWEELVNIYQNRETLDREMVESFIDSITLYNDGRIEIALRQKDELLSVLFLAAEKSRREGNCYE